MLSGFLKIYIVIRDHFSLAYAKKLFFAGTLKKRLNHLPQERRSRVGPYKTTAKGHPFTQEKQGNSSQGKRGAALAAGS